jgi:hypothetical protein
LLENLNEKYWKKGAKKDEK